MKLWMGMLCPCSFLKSNSIDLYIVVSMAKFLACWKVARRIKANFSFKLRIGKENNDCDMCTALYNICTVDLRSFVEEESHNQRMREANLEPIPEGRIQ